MKKVLSKKEKARRQTIRRASQPMQKSSSCPS